MLRKFATSLAHFCSSGSSAERNLLAQRSIGPSIVTSTVSLALAESFSTSVGILISCAPDDAENQSKSMNSSFGLFIGLVLFLLVLGRVRLGLDHFGAGTLQLAACDAKSQYKLLLGCFAPGLFPLDFNFVIPEHPQNHGCTRRGGCRPSNQGLGEETEPRTAAGVRVRLETLISGPFENRVCESRGRIFAV